MSWLMMLGGSKTTRLSETDQPPDNVRASKCVATYIDSYLSKSDVSHLT